MDEARGPVRTCVGCRGSAPKQDLLRLVLTPEGSVRVDRLGSAHGRGAYLHRDAGCAERALRGGGIARALRARLDEGGAATLTADIEGALAD